MRIDQPDTAVGSQAAEQATGVLSHDTVEHLVGGALLLEMDTVGGTDREGLPVQDGTGAVAYRQGGTIDDDVVIAPVQSQAHAMGVVAETIEMQIAPHTQHRALAREGQRSGQGLGGAVADIGMGDEGLHRRCPGIDRQAVAQADDYLDLLEMTGRCLELGTDEIIPVAQVGMLDAKAESMSASRIGAGIVVAQRKLQGISVLCLDFGIDLAGLGAGHQRDPEVIGRVLVRELDIAIDP